jgi:hypothetical protein
MFTREITFDPAFDKRDPDPKKNYGIHGVTMRAILKGEHGAVQFVLYTNWQLPHVTAEKFQREYEPINGDPHWMERPQPSDLGYHSPVPRYDGQAETSDCCDYLDGKPCYYDGSSLNAKPVFDRLLAEGSKGLWEALEAYYARIFEAEPKPTEEKTWDETGGFGEVLSVFKKAVDNAS